MRCARATRLFLLPALLLVSAEALAQTDEIQVYDAEIATPGQLTLTVHNNFTAIGRKSAEFPGGLVPHHSLNGVTEFAIGVTGWWELGAYAPAIYTIDGAGHFWLEGAKLRSLFVSPDGAPRLFYYGCNFELSYNRPHWSQSTWQLELRAIAGLHLGAWEITLNPILDVAFSDPRPDLAPAARLLHHFSKTWRAGLELYQDLGQLGRLRAATDRQQTLFATVGYSGPAIAVEFGVGTGFTRGGSDALAFKLIISPNL